MGSSRFLVWLKAAASSSPEGDVEGEDDDPFPLLSSFVSSSEVVCCEAAVRATCVLPRPLTGVAVGEEDVDFFPFAPANDEDDDDEDGATNEEEPIDNEPNVAAFERAAREQEPREGE